MAEATKWKPNANQRRVLKIFQDKEYAISVTDACRQAGLDRCAYYKWFERDPSFVAWWEAEHERFFTLGLNEIQAAIRRGALTGQGKSQTAAQKLYLERFDARYMPKSKTEIDGKLTIEGLIGELDQDETGESNGDTDECK